jgi:hypothetical protein
MGQVLPQGSGSLKGCVLGMRVPLTLASTFLTRDPDSSSSPHPELTLGMQTSPTLLSTNSEDKNTIARVSSPGTLARLGSVTHVTTFSHASPGSRGGYSVKVSELPHPTSLRECLLV